MKCFIPAAGFGTRMLDLTQKIPKPLLMLGHHTLLDYALLLAKSLGIVDVIVNTHYLAGQIEEHLEKYRSEFKLLISREEKEILGTGGGIKTALEKYSIKDDRILIINPDMLFIPAHENMSIENLLSSFPDYSEEAVSALKKDIYDFKSECLLYLSEMPDKNSYTGLSLKNGKVSFAEGTHFYTGLGVIQSSILKDVPVNRFYDLADKFRHLARENRLYGKSFPGKVVDVGDKQKYMELVPYFKESK